MMCMCVNLAGGGVRSSGPLFMCRYLKLFPLIRMIILLAIHPELSTVRVKGYVFVLFYFQGKYLSMEVSRYLFMDNDR